MQSGVGDADDDVVVEAQREAQGVETGAEIGAGGGDAHPDGGGAERGTGHLPMTLLGSVCGAPTGRGGAGPATTPRLTRQGTYGSGGETQPIEGGFSGDIGRTGGARCVS
ncbi:hypothetical protein TPA0909_61780 [Streptomyces albus]|nr:hypothetical protein TPA0909_61780 [Streptomyces albus]